ncbi:hypothetical protein DPMN_128516 [Dreissena polymorpha]|uniref:Uncharacterized protein n=1 Tax=Dreissena polymorpha TaxID=45954 RepID=A0A9D4H7A8_DREPO|nr:hypothetical protein DPMN_128516 [Dreissena polymorpha]
MNLLTKFHEDRTINVAPRVITRFYHSHIWKNAPLLGSHVFQTNVTIFQLIEDIIVTNLLIKFHEDWKINVASRVLKRKNAPPLDSHVFQANISYRPDLLTKFHEDWTINVASRVLTRKSAPPPGGHVFSPIWTIFALFHDWAKIVTSRVFTRFIYSHIGNTAPPPGGHVFQRTGTIFKLNQHII